MYEVHEDPDLVRERELLGGYDYEKPISMGSPTDGPQGGTACKTTPSSAAGQLMVGNTGANRWGKTRNSSLTVGARPFWLKSGCSTKLFSIKEAPCCCCRCCFPSASAQLQLQLSSSSSEPGGKARRFWALAQEAQRWSLTQVPGGLLRADP